MDCRVCGHPDAVYKETIHTHHWYMCHYCGSHSSAQVVPQEEYDAKYLRVNLQQGDMKWLIESMRVNLDWMERDRNPALPKDFLDIGCNEGAALLGMRGMGWTASGFDINPCAAQDGVVIADRFRASLFDRQFSLVMCREVLEHVVEWREIISEAHRATLPGGRLHIQTPAPLDWDNRNQDVRNIVYTIAHAQIFSTHETRSALVGAGWTIMNGFFWDGGQAWMCCK